MKITESLSFDTLECAKGTMSGLLNFSQRSGLLACAGMPQLDPELKERDKNPFYRCRCGYEAALRVAIMCIEHVFEEKKLEANEGLCHLIEERTKALEKE